MFLTENHGLHRLGCKDYTGACIVQFLIIADGALAQQFICISTLRFLPSLPELANHGCKTKSSSRELPMV